MLDVEIVLWYHGKVRMRNDRELIIFITREKKIVNWFIKLRVHWKKLYVARRAMYHEQLAMACMHWTANVF